MDRVFLDYYESELTHIRALAAEFAALHPSIARNLSLDTVPCPDPYVERLDGVAFLARARGSRSTPSAPGSRAAFWRFFTLTSSLLLRPWAWRCWRRVNRCRPCRGDISSNAAHA
jgi:hypothetical protein